MEKSSSLDELNKISLNGKSNDFNYQKAYSECIIDLDKNIPLPPIAMGIGRHDYKGNNYLNPTFTYGEMSAIIAPKKTKKTFFKTALTAGFIGGNAQNYFPEFNTKRPENDDFYVIEFDTEQGEFYSQKASKRVIEMVGNRFVNYVSFRLKKLTDDERVKFIDGVLNDPKYKGKILWVTIDGIADLCTNANDVVKSKAVLNKLEEWNAMGLHLCGVLHKTFDKDKGTGHLGTLFQNKVETSIFLSSTDPENKFAPIRVTQKDARGMPFEDFYFEVNKDNALPEQCSKPDW